MANVAGTRAHLGGEGVGGGGDFSIDGGEQLHQIYRWAGTRLGIQRSREGTDSTRQSVGDNRVERRCTGCEPRQKDGRMDKQIGQENSREEMRWIERERERRSGNDTEGRGETERHSEKQWETVETWDSGTEMHGFPPLSI
jgi:hypothetical protein